MITLSHFPGNKEKFVRLIEFLKEILDICGELNIAPLLNGSLAVFAYTGNHEMEVNDVDLACAETDFQRIISVLEEREIGYKLKEWHVLQILRNDLKVELDSVEHWYKGLPMNYETLQVDNHQVRMLGLDGLKEFYRRGLSNTVEKTDANEKMKYAALKSKFEALERIKS
jgi:hypothetical protein